MEETSNKDIKLFLRFLKDNGFYALYSKNIKKNDGKIYRNCIKNHFSYLLDANENNMIDFLHNVRPSLFINYSFSTSASIEGYDYWLKVNNKWLDYLWKIEIETFRKKHILNGIYYK